MAVTIIALIVIAAAMARPEDRSAGREFWRKHEWWMLLVIVVFVGWVAVGEVMK